MGINDTRAVYVLGDVRPDSVDRTLWPYSAQPQTDGKWCILAYHHNAERICWDLGRDEAFMASRLLNEDYWSSK